MSVTTQKYNQEAAKIGEIELSERIFNTKLNENLIHQAMVRQMSNMRQVLAHTKGRAEVRGGGAKPWRQKGTGRARVGSRRSPIWIGGGITFGPTKERNFSKDINKKMRQKAVYMVLSDKLKNNRLVILDDLKTAEYKTKNYKKLILDIEKNIINNPESKNINTYLTIIKDKDEKIKYSGNNLPNAKTITINNLNIVDLLHYKYLIITEASIKEIEKNTLK